MLFKQISRQTAPKQEPMMNMEGDYQPMPTTVGQSFQAMNGSVQVCAILARSGIHAYKEGELKGIEPQGKADHIKVLRQISILEEMRNQCVGLPIVLNHPNEYVNVENWKKHARGVVLNAWLDEVEDHGILRAELLVWCPELINTLVSRGSLECSLGYEAEYDRWEYDNSHLKGDQDWNDEINLIDMIQRNVKVNHLALVDESRCGDECVCEVDSTVTPVKVDESAHALKAGLLSPSVPKEGSRTAYKKRMESAWKSDK